jgi:cell division protein FtsW
MVLLLSVFIPGLTFGTKGASRWIIILGMSFQPSELAKLTFIIYLSAWLDQRRNKLNDTNEGFIPFLMLIALVAVPIVKQPDIGTLISICLVAFTMYFMAGAGLRYMGMIFVGGVGAVMLLAKIEPYRMNRLKVFMHPELDPQGIGYQINQALLALGSVGLFGLGLGHSRQKFNYLPEPIGDSVFAITGEELGLVGLLFLIVLYLIFALRGFAIAESARDGFGKLLAIGITSWIIFQSIMNIGAITSLIPLTGIPLPFVSYGGSSVISLLIGMGILLSISKFGNSYKK